MHIFLQCAALEDCVGTAFVCVLSINFICIRNHCKSCTCHTEPERQGFCCSSCISSALCSSIQAGPVLKHAHHGVQSTSQRRCTTGRLTAKRCWWQQTPHRLQTNLLGPPLLHCPCAMLRQLWQLHPAGKKPFLQRCWLASCWFPITLSSARPEGCPKLPGPWSSAGFSSWGSCLMVSIQTCLC